MISYWLLDVGLPELGDMKMRMNRMRGQRGSLIALGLILLLVLIPLGVVVYDITLIRMQYNQLKTATDAAALAAAAWVADSEEATGDGAAVSPKAQNIALAYFRANHLSAGTKYSGKFENAESAASDISADTLHQLGQSRLYTSVDPSTRRATVETEFCVQPSLLSMFGLYTLHARSVAGATPGIAGDVCFVVDLSASMTMSTKKSQNVERLYIPDTVRKINEKTTTSGTDTYIERFAVPAHLDDFKPHILANITGDSVHPFVAAGWCGNPLNPQIPNPDSIDFTPSPNPSGYKAKNQTPNPDLSGTKAPRLSINASDTPLLYNLINSFANKYPAAPPPITVPPTENTNTLLYSSNPHSYPTWPYWPPINANKQFTYMDSAAAKELKVYDVPTNSASYDPTKDPKPFLKTATISINSYSMYTIPEMMAVVLRAAKAGFLEDASGYNQLVHHYPELADLLKQFGIDSSSCKKGYQREYQKLAMCLCHAVETQVAIMHSVIESVSATTPSAHWSLVGFGKYAPGLRGTQPPSNNQSGPPYDWNDNLSADHYQFPLIPLSQSNNNASSVLARIDEATCSWGTDTPDAIKEGICQLNGPGHRDGQTKTLVLMTDGMPTHGGTFKVVKPDKKGNWPGVNGINVVLVGLFEGSYACPDGPRFIKKLQKVTHAQMYNYPAMVRNCGKAAGSEDINLEGDAAEIASFIKKSLGGGGSIGLLE